MDRVMRLDSRVDVLNDLKHPFTYPQRICLVGELVKNPVIRAAAHYLARKVVCCETGLLKVKDSIYHTYFVLQEFEGATYENLRRAAHQKDSFLGPTVLVQLAKKKDLPTLPYRLPLIKYPLYTLAMEDVKVIFSGFQDEKELEKLANMVHMMGGHIRKKIDKATHLVATCCYGEKYKKARKAKLPIVKSEWVKAWWEEKTLVLWNPSLNEDLLATHKLHPFYGAKICFFGFDKKDEKFCCEILKEQDGEQAQIDNEDCTHVVVARTVNTIPSAKSKSAFIVIQDWFWKSINLQAREDENDYLFANFNILINKEPSVAKMLLEKRRETFLSLVDSEIRYMHVLDTIMTRYKLPLENFVGKGDKEVLSALEINIIFDKFLPIYEIHKEFVEKLRNIDVNKGTINVGRIFLQFHRELQEVYLSYFTYFGTSEAMLRFCEEHNLKFAVFLKTCELYCKCCKYSLKELLWSPMTQLEELLTLLLQISECTDENSLDYFNVQASLRSLEELPNYIRYTLRRINIHKLTFEMFTRIDRFPLDLVWENHQYFGKQKVREVKHGGGQGDRLILCVFTDCLVVCKNKILNSHEYYIRHNKIYEYIMTLDFKRIKQIAVVKKNNDYTSIFALEMREPDQIFAFDFSEKQYIMFDYLYTLYNYMAKTNIDETPNSAVKLRLWEFEYVQYKITDIQALSKGIVVPYQHTPYEAYLYY